MALISRGLLTSAANPVRSKKIFLSFGVFSVALALAAGIYFYARQNKQQNDDAAAAPAQTANALPTEWVAKYFLTDDENAPHVGGPEGDPDDDILTNYQEYLYGTNPTKEDTDDDGDIDSYEVAFNQNPNGENVLVMTNQARDYVAEVIEGNEKFSAFSKANLAAEINAVLKTDQAVVFDFPIDSELVISAKNDPQEFEKYFNETIQLAVADPNDFQDIEGRLFDGMSDQELDFYIERLQATEKILMKIPVPSEIVNIQKLKIAGLRAGIRMFELVRDRYVPENEDSQFWADLFQHMVVIESVGIVETQAWNQLGTYLKDTGGWEEAADGK